MPGPDAHVLGRVRIPARALVLSCGLWSSCASSMAHAPLMLCMMWCDCRAPVVRVACKVAWCVRARSRELSFDREDDRQDSTPTGHRLHLGSALSAWLLGRGFGDRQFWWIAPIASSVGRLGPGRRVRSCHFQVPAFHTSLIRQHHTAFAPSCCIFYSTQKARRVFESTLILHT